MFRNLVCGLAGLVLLGLSTGHVHAQDNLIGELFGRGVHAFYAGEYVEAHTLLTSAIQQGTDDPRCYYFRGLAYQRLGRPEDADQDFAQGAVLEISGESFYPVARSLERIQGTNRLQIEKARQYARIAAREREMQRDQQRYEEGQMSEQRVLRQPVEAEGTSEPVAPIADVDIAPTDAADRSPPGSCW